jgi:tetratricopeptide (TPR) repeat protein
MNEEAMNPLNFRALAATLFLSAATVALSGAVTIAPADAAARPAVGKLLQQAIEDAKSGNTGAANAKVSQAEGVGGLTPGDHEAIEQVKSFINAKNGSGATGSKAKFAQDYNAGRYNAVVGEDADALRKAGQYDGQSELIVAQAYYQMGNYAEAIRMLKGMSGDTAQGLLMAAAAKSGDTQGEMQAAEHLVAAGQTKYWPYLLIGAEGTHGLSDHQNLDILRLRLLTGNMRGVEDYQTGTELALEAGDSAGAQSFAQKGIAAKVLTDQRSQRLAGLATAAATKDAATLPAQIAAAKTGDAMLKIGEKQYGMGKYPDAISTIQAAIAKGVTDKNAAQILLGQSQIGAGNKDAAIHAFNQVTGDPKEMMIAHIWTVYARTMK